MKKSLISAMTALCVLFSVAPECDGADISAGSALVYEPFSGSVLYEKNADERMLIASTTKIMTALVVIENCAPDEKVNVKREHAALEGSSMYLKPGEDYTVEDLLYGLMLASGNDAAAALAEHCAGSMDAFADMMNAKCRQWGLENTHFVNSHGLDDERQYSTARELAVITAKAMENEAFCRIFAAKSCSVNGLNYKNHNKLLSICPGCIGGKTGYTEKAGRILVSCVEREGMRLICVTISDPRDWEDHMRLYECCFSQYEFISLPGTRIEVLSGDECSLDVRGSKTGFVAEKGSGQELRINLPDFVFAPVEKGDALGRAELIMPDGKTMSIELTAAESVALDESQRAGVWDKVRKLWKGGSGFGIYYPG